MGGGQELMDVWSKYYEWVRVDGVGFGWVFGVKGGGGGGEVAM